MKIPARVFPLLLALHICLCVRAVPALPRPVRVTQPDGTSLMVRLSGDEFSRICTTVDGHAVIKDGDGWWRYASYDGLGKRSSGYAVGAEAPQSVLRESESIPYALIRAAAGTARRDKARLMSQGAGTKVTTGGHTWGGAIGAGSGEDAATKSEDGEGIRTVRGLVILAAFADLGFTYTKEDFEAMLGGEGYAYNDATGSAAQYFNDQFLGEATFSFDVSPIVTLTQTAAYYGGNGDDGSDANAWRAVAEACQAAYTAGIDFSKYDTDGDGVVDCVSVFVPGESEAEGGGDDCIWPHQWYVRSGAGATVNLGGVLLDKYAISTELSRQGGSLSMTPIGTFCHEFSHTLGLMDMYDTDGETGGSSTALFGSTSVMSTGCYNNSGNTPAGYDAIDRWCLGIGEEEALGTGDCTLEPIRENGRYLKFSTETEGEAFLFCVRDASGWDRYAGGSGLLVYHVNKSSLSAGSLTYAERWLSNTVNASSDYEGAKILPCVTPDVSGTGGYENVYKAFYPYGGKNSFTPDTYPAFVTATGESSPLSITGITKGGDGSVSFTVTGPIAIDGREIFQDAAIVGWHTENEDLATEDCLFSWWTEGGDTVTVSLAPYGGGKYSCTVEGLTPETTYKAEIYYRVGTEEEKIGYFFTFTTLPYYSDSHPFIWLQDVERHIDGRFEPGVSKLPLRVANVPDAESVQWAFDGKGVTVESDGYYTVTSAGTLAAVVTYADGSHETLVKEIVTE